MVLKGILKKLIFLVIISIILVLIIDWHVKKIGGNNIISHDDDYKAQAAIVLGAYVSPEGILCDMLKDRVQTAVELYKSGKVEKILMTGDHSKTSYDEVNHMRKYAEQLGVPTKDIFMDHAGLSTYDSMYRARDIFCVKSAVVVTQKFHLPRAVYIANSMGINAKGVIADKHIYRGADYYEIREILARNKDFINVTLLKPKPKFLGPTLSITGDGRITHD
ncbi:SanA protein [Desulfohalotomaculum tongense]|uniref:SanA/YdcF family protein n=1 Tax=Desulforadius tongensis TaxID=1216062 RepID=UPI00195BD73B|nr:ElyC/SanA/YdcF family protein [Desulforadius tongensis]MBM7855150.1 SanA protein [Desulforadius tongensis]